VDICVSSNGYRRLLIGADKDSSAPQSQRRRASFGQLIKIRARAVQQNLAVRQGDGPPRGGTAFARYVRSAGRSKAVLFGWRADNFATDVVFGSRQESSEPKHRVAHPTPTE
jgi:hypothetical protein